MLNGSYYPPGNIRLERLKCVIIRFVAIDGVNSPGQNMGKDCEEFAVSGLLPGFIESDPVVSIELQQWHKHPRDISFEL
jgi:hypothetical protein